MSSNIIERDFYNTCVTIRYPCKVNDHYIDPCSCTSYFQCATPNSILHRPCAAGNGFDHKKNTCRLLTNIVNQDVCDQKKPWDRCSDDYNDVDEDALEQRCTNMAPDPTKGGDGRVDGGLIAGIVIAVLVVVIIAVLVIIYVRKKGNPLRNLRSAKSGWGQGTSQSSAPRHGAGAEEETYAEIEDTAMYKDPSGGRHLVHSLSHTNETYDRDEEVAYDNPALKRDTPPPLPEAPPDYSALEMEHMPRSYSSLNEHKATTKNDRNSTEPMTGDDGYLVAEAIGESRLSTGPEDPKYFTLEKSET